MAGNKGLHCVAWVLVMVGGLNWLLYGLFHWDVGSLLGGMTGTVARIVYILVGLSAVYEIVTHGKSCGMCKPNNEEVGGSSGMQQ